ncbi:MAG: multidrug transporter [Desulfovibrio sp. MES5]|uniref:DMT family transporter n=1 Tax=Desulfovibrio sp. MES5 TaxID=1899016 RepID=UPI000B9D1846|nr:DMT family transporter [Desulfovibrio sp. MES5]OXS28267.1 MAG: multidrug transporter [Desulfovibrio sp. MES5]
MSDSKKLPGHLAALFCTLVWGTTFISTKVLLRDFSPIEILFFRFALGFAALWLACPHALRLTERKQEWLFAGAGLAGVTLYFLLENIALTHTFASNVGVIVGVSPFFTALLSFWLLKAEKPGLNFFLGFAAAIAGIGLISFSGSTQLQLNPIGDLLAVLAGLAWSFYSILTRKILALGYKSLQVTRRCFFYGLLFMLPCLPFMNFHWDLARFGAVVNWSNVVFLGLGASALCFVAWTFAIKRLGAVQSSVYIYLVPVVTVITAALILQERITWMAALGTALTLAGLVVSEIRQFGVRRKAESLQRRGQGSR